MTEAAAAEPAFRVLCVDDEPHILSALKRVLRDGAQRILTAESGAQAIELMAEQPVDLIVSDMRMPVMDGARLLETVRERWPATVRILLTGHADLSAVVAAVNRGEIFRYITKPWDESDLKATVAQALERTALRREKERLELLTQSQNLMLSTLNATLELRVAQRTTELNKANEQLKRNYMTSIKVFSNLIELRGKQWLGHSRRLADQVRKLAQEMGRSDDEVHEVFVAALLHDIGLIGLPDAVLAKPVAKLTAEELELYRGHPALGEQSLLALEGLQPVAALIRAHHERFDGQGFPDRRAGADIPLGARMLAVVDACDDLTNGHLSSAVLRPEEAHALVQRGRGGQFDPEVVDVYLHMLMRQPAKPAALLLTTDRLLPGMVLARDLTTTEGAMLLAADTVLSADLIRRICDFDRREKLGLKLHIHPAAKPG